MQQLLPPSKLFVVIRSQFTTPDTAANFQGHVVIGGEFAGIDACADPELLVMVD
jgi:hypothetical protein